MEKKLTAYFPQWLCLIVLKKIKSLLIISPRSFMDFAISEIFPLRYQELGSSVLYFFYIDFCYCHFCRKLVFTQDSAKHLLYCSGVNESGIKQADYGIALIRACVSELCQHNILLSWHAQAFVRKACI